MKFELDHRTGMMRPKKDEEIHFAQSQGGGLIVDDKKNNIKYVIERDGRITKLFGSFNKDNLNLYDMRDARIIADRVRRLLGVNHKYTDFHYFLRGYHMNESVIESCSDFLGESIWGDLAKRSGGTQVRSEEGGLIGRLPDGSKMYVSIELWNKIEKGECELINFEEGNYYTLYDGFYLTVINEDGNDVYYIYAPGVEEDYNMIEITRWNGDTFRTKHEFAQLRAVLQSADEEGDELEPIDLNGLDVNSRDNNGIDIEMDNYDYLIFEDRDDAVSYAVDYERELLDQIKIDKKSIERWRSNIGDDIFDEDELKDVFKETFEFDYDDRDEEDIIDELLRLEIIEDSEEYFDVDEDGDIDHTLPKFDYQNYKDKYVETILDSIDDFVDEYISRFGSDGIEKYLDLDKLAEKFVEIDGPEHSISTYDGKEREVEIDGTTYYIYRRN